MKRVVVSWSSGKDAAWSLHVLRAAPDVEVIGLLTTVVEGEDRVSMHGVPAALVEAQANSLELPLLTISLPDPCPNTVYEEAMRGALERIVSDGATHMAFGDLFLEDVRTYREQRLSGTGIEPLFPLWQANTTELAREMVRQGLQAVLTVVDTAQLADAFAGRSFDRALLDELPASVDPCGERGEFHTFVWDGPMLRSSVPVSVGTLRCEGRFARVPLGFAR